MAGIFNEDEARDLPSEEFKDFLSTYDPPLV